MCDGADNDCNGVVDDDAVDAVVWSLDDDGDGHGLVGSDEALCGGEADYVVGVGDDCDDGDRTVSPSAPEVCLDGVDQDCDGEEGDSFCEQATVDREDDGSGAAFLAVAAGDLDGDGVAEGVVARADTTLVGFAGPWAAGELDAGTWAWTATTGFGAGTSLELADLGGDGTASMFVGAPDAGQVLVLDSPLTTGLDTPTWWVDGEGQAIGTGLALGVDHDRDGAEDIVIGCASCAPDSAEQGVVSIQTLGAAGSSVFAGDVAELVGDEAERLGERLAVVDVDGDGFPELFLSSELEGLRRWNGPVVGNLDESTSDKEYNVGDPGGDYALSLADVGDLNGDGAAELGVGEPTLHSGSVNGTVSVYGDSSYDRLTIGGAGDHGLGTWVRAAGGMVVVGIRDMGTAVFDGTTSGSLELEDAVAAMAVEDPAAALAIAAGIGDADGDGIEDAVVPEEGPTANRLRWWSGAGW